MALNGFLMGDVISSDTVWGALLRQNGFRKFVVPDTCPDCYTVEDFCQDHPAGTYVVKSPGHVAAVIDGNLYDAWNSENQVVLYYWTKDQDEAV